MAAVTNTRACGLCRHLDSRTLNSGAAFCWRFWKWERAERVVTDCTGAERADGQAPPGRLYFEGEQN